MTKFAWVDASVATSTHLLPSGLLGVTSGGGDANSVGQEMESCSHSKAFRFFIDL